MEKKEKNKLITKEIFYFFSLLCLILFVLEVTLQGLVSVYLNFNFLLVIWMLLLVYSLKTNKC